MQSYLKRILLKKLVAYCEHSTLHGAYYLKSRGGACVVWAAIMAAGLGLCGVLSHMIWEKYSIDPTVTVVESTYYRSEQIPFPAVMICDSQPVYGPNTDNISHILSSRGYDNKQIDEFYDSFLSILKTTYVPAPYLRKMHSLLEDLGFSLEILVEMFKKPCDAVMVECFWRSKQYKCSHMFREVVTVVGHCCLFDIAHFRQLAPKNTTFTPGKEVTEALEVTVDGTKIFSNGTNVDGQVFLYIFDAANDITMLDGAIPLASASYFDVDLEIFIIDSSADVKALPVKIRKCALPTTDRGLHANFYQKCIATLMMHRVANNCKCIPFMYTAEGLSVEDYPNCTWERYMCIYPQLETTFADMHSLIRTNDCYQNCDYVEYESKVDYIRKLRMNSGTQNDSHTRLAIHYASSTCIKYRRELIYTWDQMLANLGGIFGLCLGGSIISIIEIIWFTIDLLATALHGFMGKTKLKPVEKKVAFVIDKDVGNGKDKRKDGCYKFAN